MKKALALTAILALTFKSVTAFARHLRPRVEIKEGLVRA